MEETKIQLGRSASAVFNASGVATAVLSNGGLSRWQITNTAVSSTSTKQTKCTTYRGPAAPSNQVDFTRVGNGRSSDTQIPLASGEFLTVVWENGTPGTVATVTVIGDEFLQGRRIY